MPPPRCLVAGSYPPVPGPAAAATVGAVRRAWAAGLEVLVASPRPSAATYVLATTGRGLARRLGSLGREHGCDQVVLCAEPGWPLPGPVPSRLAGLPLGRRARRWAAQLSRWLYERRQASSARALAAALAGYRHAELVVTGSAEDLTPCMASLAALCRAAAAVTAASEPLAGALRRAAAGHGAGRRALCRRQAEPVPGRRGGLARGRPAGAGRAPAGHPGAQAARSHRSQVAGPACAGRPCPSGPGARPSPGHSPALVTRPNPPTRQTLHSPPAGRAV